MKLKKQLLKIAATAVSAALLISPAGITTLAAESTPIGYFETLVSTVSLGADLSDPNYALYRSLLEEQDGIVSAIYKGLSTGQSEIDVSEYNFDFDATKLQTLYEIMCYSFPELWYVNKWNASYYSNNNLAKVYPTYSTEYGSIDQVKAEFFSTADDLYLSLVDDSMDDFTKAVVLHDALVLNTFYTKDVQNDRGNNYTYMVQNYGVCQFYAECYAYLLAQCGIRSELISSNSMNHAWLKVNLDGEYYNIDSTWDDPTPDKVGRVSHSYFLNSDAAFQTTDTNRNQAHTGYTSIHPAQSTKYDGFDNLHSIHTQLCRVDGTFYAITQDGRLVTYNYQDDSVGFKKQLDSKWYVSDNSGSYYSGSYSSLVEYDGKLYYNSQDKVYSYDPSSEETVQFAESQNSDGKKLYGIRITDNKLWGVYASSPNEGYITPTYMKDMTKIERAVTIDNSISGGTVVSDKQTATSGETVTLTVSANEGYKIDSVKVNGAEISPSQGVYSFKMPSKSVNITADFGFADKVGARLIGNSISLKGDIGVNFYMDLDPSVAGSDTAYVKFSIPNGDETEFKTVKVKDAETKDIDGKTYYIFNCSTAAKEMTSMVKAQVIDGDKKGTEYSYSVKEYAQYLLSHTSENQKYAKAAPLVRAMLNYGANAQKYFDKNTTDLANDILTESEKSLDSVTSNTINLANIVDSLPQGVDFKGATLSLKAQTTLSLYFKSDKNLTFSCDGMTVETTEVNGYKVARIRNIEPKNLKNVYTLTVSTGDSSGTVNYSVMNYCKNVLNSASTSDNLKNVVKAIYLYSEEANKYFI